MILETLSFITGTVALLCGSAVLLMNRFGAFRHKSGLMAPGFMAVGILHYMCIPTGDPGTWLILKNALLFLGIIAYSLGVFEKCRSPLTGMRMWTAYLPAAGLLLGLGALASSAAASFKEKSRILTVLAAALFLAGDGMVYTGHPAWVSVTDLSALLIFFMYLWTMIRRSYEMKIAFPIAAGAPLAFCCYMVIAGFYMESGMFRQLRAAAAAAVIAASSAAAYFIALSAGKSIRRVVDEADGITGSNLSQEIKAGPDELTSALAGTFNRLVEAVRLNRNDLAAELKKTKRLNELKEEFLRNVTHELRTPLTAVIGNLNLAMRKASSDEVAEPVKNSLAESKRLFHLIESLLEYSRLKAGEAKPALHEFDLRQCVDIILSKDIWKNGKGGCKVRNEVLSVGAVGDMDMTGKALTELLRNAVEYGAEGGEIVLKTLLTNKNDTFDTVELVVADRGRGMSLEILENIFEEFEQGDGSATRRHGGAGLGLSLASELMRIQGGSIRAESEEGKGSAFSLILPAA